MLANVCLGKFSSELCVCVVILHISSFFINMSSLKHFGTNNVYAETSSDDEPDDTFPEMYAQPHSLRSLCNSLHRQVQFLRRLWSTRDRQLEVGCRVMHDKQYIEARHKYMMELDRLKQKGIDTLEDKVAVWENRSTFIQEVCEVLYTFYGQRAQKISDFLWVADVQVEEMRSKD